MKFAININQKAVSDSGLANKTDLTDWALIDYIIAWSLNKKAVKLDGYTWVNYKHLSEEMPLLGLNTKGAVSNRIKKLKGLGLIDTIQDNDKRLYVDITDFTHSIVSFSNSKSGAKTVKKGCSPKCTGVHEDEQGVHIGEQSVHENEQGGVHDGEHSTYNHISTYNQNIKSNNKRFIIPGKSEIIEYMLAIGLTNSDAEAFFDYYTSNGWKVGKQSMKDWKASCRNWKRNKTKFNGNLSSKQQCTCNPLYGQIGYCDFCMSQSNNSRVIEHG